MNAERIPVIEMQGSLLVSVQKELSDTDALALQDDLLHRLRDSGAAAVILDVTGVEVVDSYIARVFNDIGGAARAMGAQTILVGLRPAAAITLVEMDVALDHVRSALTLDQALAMLAPRTAKPVVRRTRGKGTPGWE